MPLETEQADPAPIEHRLHDILSLLAATPLRQSSEKMAQGDLEQALEAADIPFEREVTLSPGSIVDFMVGPPGGEVAIEMKLRARRKEIYRQLNRYAEHERVQAIILLTGTATGLPQAIKGKPTVVQSMGAAWL